MSKSNGTNHLIFDEDRTGGVVSSGKNNRAKILCCQGKLKYNKKVGNQTASDLFWFYFSPTYFF